MGTYSFSHLSDPVLLREFLVTATRDCATTALLLAQIAEIDLRRLYLSEGYPSMFAFCVDALHFSEDIAKKRIRAARAARRVPCVLDAVAEGRLHLSGVAMLAHRLSPENADTLLAAAAHKTRSEIEELLAAWFPRLEVPALVQAIAPTLPDAPMSAGTPGGTHASPLTLESLAPEPSGTGQGAPGPLATSRPKVEPLSAEYFTVQFTMKRSTRDKLRRVEELLGHPTSTRPSARSESSS